MADLAASGRSSSAMPTPPFSPPRQGPSDVSHADWLIAYPPPRSLPLDQEAVRIYERAYAIGLLTEPEDAPRITFTSVMLALLIGQDETSQGFAQLAERNGPAKAEVFSEKVDKSGSPLIDENRARQVELVVGKPRDVRVSADKHLMTASARAVLTNAEAWAQRVGGTDIGVRHLVASYVLNPPAAHQFQMKKWQYQETQWRTDFFPWVAQRYTAEQWTDASQRPAPTKAAPIAEQQTIVVHGQELALPGDANTDAVLDAAASLHALRDDQWLRFRTIFYALISHARHNEPIANEIGPLMTATIAVADQYRRSYEEYFANPEKAKPVRPFAELAISPRVLNMFATARDLAVATRHDAHQELQVSVLHLAGALLSRRVDADDELVSLGLSPQALRGALIDFAKAKGQSADAWHEIVGDEETIQQGRPVELNSDDPEAVVRLDESWASDPLGIRRDVETFAALLASKSLQPPLSIGLLGPWGSGKTTFLKRLRRAVDRLAGDAGKVADSRLTPYVANVVHVDFNAWHFAETALTSSLVDTIFRALIDHIKSTEPRVGEAWRRATVEKLESTRRKVQAAEQVETAARDAVSTAERDLDKKQKEAANALTNVQSVLQTAWSEIKNQLTTNDRVRESGVLDAISDTIASGDALRAQVDTLRDRPLRVFRDLGFARTVLFAALVIGLPPLVAWLLQFALGKSSVVELMSFLTTGLATVGVWIGAASRAVSRFNQALDEVDAQYQRRIAANANVREAATALAVAQTTAASAASALTAAWEDLVRAQAEASNASLPAQVLQLVSNRVDAQSYNKELTSISLARADLSMLSQILRDQQLNNAASPTSTTGAADARSASPARAVDRVILYIDDLDRCKPDDVVRVLQLVHMLLAFELFVVVVAVDARWVDQALKESYKWLARPADAPPERTNGNVASRDHQASQDSSYGFVTPHDYLDKIFQIAFWLEPMTASGAASYFGSLVRSPLRSDGPVFDAESVSTATGPSGSIPNTLKVEISGIELDYMRALAAYVGSSPRRVKRLVNAYRLIKAGLGDAQLHTFLTDPEAGQASVRSGPYQIVIGLLVIATGASSNSSAILEYLAKCDPGTELTDVVGALRKRNHADWTMAAQVIETLMRTQLARDVRELRGWAGRVRRFLLSRADVGGLPYDFSSTTPQQDPQLEVS